MHGSTRLTGQRRLPTNSRPSLQKNHNLSLMVSTITWYVVILTVHSTHLLNRLLFRLTKLNSECSKSLHLCHLTYIQNIPLLIAALSSWLISAWKLSFPTSKRTSSRTLPPSLPL